MKKLLFSSIAILSSCVLSAQNLPDHGNSYLNDFANVINAEDRVHLEDKLRSLERNTSIEMSMVTIQSLEGGDIETYANKLFAKWGIGKRGLDNGILVLVSVQDRTWRIEVGYGLEGWLTDADSRRLGSSALPPNFRQGNYYAGLDALANGIIAKLGPESWAQREAYKAQQEKEARASQEAFMNGVILVSAFLLFGALILFIYFQRKRKERKIQEEKERKEKQIRLLSDYIKGALIKYTSTIKTLEELESQKFKNADNVLKKFRDAETRTKDLTGQITETEENLSASKILLDNILVPLFKESDAILAVRNKIEAIKKHADGMERTVAETNARLADTDRDYRSAVEKHGPEVWSYNFAFTFLYGEANRHLSSANMLAMDCKDIDSNNFEQKERMYNDSRGRLDDIERQISSVAKRKKQIEDAVEYVGRNRNSLRPLLGDMEHLRHKSDVSSTTKSRMDKTKEDTEQILNSDFKNPLIAHAAISSAIAALEDAIRRAKNDIADAERNRREEEEARLRRIRNASTSSYSSRSGSGGGGGFGGFGGGRSGGGGATGKW